MLPPMLPGTHLPQIAALAGAVFPHCHFWIQLAASGLHLLPTGSGVANCLLRIGTTGLSLAEGA